MKKDSREEKRRGTKDGVNVKTISRRTRTKTPKQQKELQEQIQKLLVKVFATNRETVDLDPNLEFRRSGKG